MKDENNIADDLDFREGDALRATISADKFLSLPTVGSSANGALENILKKLSTSIKEQDKEAAKYGSFVAATEASFIARLDRAMEKNFEYIIRQGIIPTVLFLLIS